MLARLVGPQDAEDLTQTVFAKAARALAKFRGEAFDEYRAATLQRLREEQHDFHGFLARLRAAKDRAEFDQFMGERRAQSSARG